jgi:hypothetical protein
MQDEDSDESKEVFARFGLAFYWSAIFEGDLAIAVLCLDFARAHRGHGPEAISTEAAAEEFDRFLHKEPLRSLRELVSRLPKIGRLPDELQQLFSHAAEEREFLTHHFWREHAVELPARAGREEMLDHLQDSQRLFEQADAAIQSLTAGALASVGMSQDGLRDGIERFARAKAVH